MKRKIQVQVTESDIRDGMSGNCRECPIAHALRRVFLGYVIEAYSFEAWICSRTGQILRKVALPFEARKFVIAFDEGMKLEPFEFTIEICG